MESLGGTVRQCIIIIAITCLHVITTSLINLRRSTRKQKSNEKNYHLKPYRQCARIVQHYSPGGANV